MFLKDAKTREEVLDKRWHSKCPKCDFFNVMRRQGQVCGGCNEKTLEAQPPPRILVINSEFKEGIDVYWATEISQR